MLTEDQQKWIDHLSDEDTISIVPFDPSCEEKFQEVKRLIQSKFGEGVEVKHCGATSLGISGQDEIDVYIPVSPEDFDSMLIPLTELFGTPRSHYRMERARFVVEIQEKHIDVFLINKEGDGWNNGLIFEEHLRENSDALDAYRKLKEEGDGVSVREYYRRKIEFINSIVEKAKHG